MNKAEFEKWADKIDDAKERNAIGDLSAVAYQILNLHVAKPPKRKILLYESFTDSEDFERWQMEHPEVRITQLMPFINEISGQQTGDYEGKAEVDFGILVVYYKDE